MGGRRGGSVGIGRRCARETRGCARRWGKRKLMGDSRGVKGLRKDVNERAVATERRENAEKELERLDYGHP